MTDGDTGLHIVRVLDAPRERMWRAWTDPMELARWWWPERFRTTYELDVREGGTYHFETIELPDIGRLSLWGIFLDVVPRDRLVYTWRWEHETLETRVTVEFLDLGSRTEVCVRQVGLATGTDRDDHVAGWNDCLNRLEALLADARPHGSG